MKYELGQLVKSHHDSSIWMVTKVDRENEHYEIEDGIGTCYYSHDEILSPITDKEFFHHLQTKQLTSTRLIKSYLKSQGMK